MNTSKSYSMLELRSRFLVLLEGRSTIGYMNRNGLTLPEHLQVERTMRRQRIEGERHLLVFCQLDAQWYGHNCIEKY
jgi:hypothetical protein